MDIWEIDNLKLFLLFFVPGFISLKVYGLMIASERLDFSKSVFDAIAYSCLNFAFFFPLLVVIHRGNFETEHETLYFLSMGFLLIVSPAAWPILITWLMKRAWLKKYILSPYRSSWDFYFDQRKGGWVIIKLKNGDQVGGKYGHKSFASAYPAETQVYLEEHWEVDANDKFIQIMNRTDGIIILGKEIDYIKFFN